jgi:Tfp pilus assembly protein PilO
MKAAIIERLAALPARTLWLAIGAVLALALLEGWLLVLRQPFGEYLKLRNERSAFETAAAAPGQVATEVERAERQLAALKERLAGAETPAAPERAIVQLMDRVAGLASRHGATLHGVRPVEGKRAHAFEETAFEIQGAGSYPALLEWLEGIERELAPFVIAHFSIKRATGSETLAMDVRLAAYRLEQRTGEAK